MRLVVLCEESQVGVSAFLKYGFDAYSCDIKPCSGDYPERHIQADALDVLHYGNWDIVIAHPPCTFLSNVQTHLLRKDPNRYPKMVAARQFFMDIWNYCKIYGIPCAIENPLPSPYALLPEHSQMLHPYMFGDPYTKATYWWLSGLPPVIADDFVVPVESWVNVSRSAEVRSKSFPGMMNAMAAAYADFFALI